MKTVQLTARVLVRSQGRPGTRMPSWFLLLSMLGLAGSMSDLAAGDVPPVRSPEVHADRKVTFRLKAPKAGEVKLVVSGLAEGEGLLRYGGGTRTFDLTKNPAGVWSVTVGPFAPDLYDYHLQVDGQPWGDPNAGAASWRNAYAHAESMLDVPAEQPRFHDFRPEVPHGAVRLHTFFSKLANSRATMVVYTPPGYDTEPARIYPVLYLFHGWGSNEQTCTELGRAHWIADNLIAAGQAQPMIIVMPFGHHAGVPYPASSTDWPKDQPRRAYDGYGGFMKFIVQDVVPEIEKNYRAAPDPKRRAVAGISMGGHQALQAAFDQTDQFAFVCAMSPNVNYQVSDSNAARLKTLKLFQVMVGRQDFLYKSNKEFAETAAAHGVPLEFVEFDGWHDMTSFRGNMTRLLPRLFIE